jgi:hypothetical protein
LLISTVDNKALKLLLLLLTGCSQFQKLHSNLVAQDG